VAARLWSRLTGLVHDENRQRLERLLELPDGLACRASSNCGVRQPRSTPGRWCGVGTELRRYEVAGLTSLACSRVRICALARYATMATSGDVV
jgi:hypothetical protein